MKTGNFFHFCKCATGGVLAVALGCVLTGCPAKQTVNNTTAAPTQPPPVTYVEEPPVVVPEGLIYYPDYEVYYDPGPQIYWWYAGGRWDHGPEPIGVSVEVLRHSNSARMDFHDSPENHHAEVVKQYPHNWRPADHDRRGP